MTDSRHNRRDIGVVFVYPKLTSFIDVDLQLLRKTFRVLPYEYAVEKGAGRRFLSFLFANRRAYDVVFVWFGDVYATLAVQASKVLGKKVLIVAGGYDTTYIPSTGYGMLSSPKRRRRARRAFSDASRVLVVDGSLANELKHSLSVDGSNIQVVPTGYDPDVFRPSGTKDDHTVLSVGAVSSANVKRFDTFVGAARELPEFQFRIVGALEDNAAENLRMAAPPNVVFAGHLTRDALIAEYQRAKVYAQLSMFEGLPNALAEAMLCECVPVGTPVGGIPTLIGDCGFYASVGDVPSTAARIRDAARSPLGPRAREKVIREFHIEQRERALTDIVLEIAGG